jgi:hypothetical protein
MQRVYLYGVPYYLDTNNHVYLWDPSGAIPATPLGTYDPINGTIAYSQPTESHLQDKLEAWRAAVQPRPRNTPTPIYPTSGAAPKIIGEAHAEQSDGEDDV